MKYKDIDGFTILEMSTVIVIISFVIGGIIIGSDIIRSTKIMSIISDVEQYKKSLNNFQEKYIALPGDIPNASDYWTSTAGNGDGDGRIESGENLGAWEHLMLANMVNGTFTGALEGGAWSLGVNAPQSKIKGGGYMITHESTAIYGKTGNVIEFGSELGNYLWGGVLSSIEAEGIDNKIDDGDADAGLVFSLQGYNGTSWQGGCVTGTNSVPSNYSYTNDDPDCRMFFWLK